MDFLGMSGFVLKKEGALWICGRCVSWLGKERERSPSFLVSFWGSIISLLAIQEVWILFSDSLPVFVNSYFCLPIFCRVKGWVWAWLWGCAYKGEQKVRSPYQESLWRNLACTLMALWANTPKRGWIKYDVNFSDWKSYWKINMVIFSL